LNINIEEFPEDDGVINPFKNVDSSIIAIYDSTFTNINGGLGSVLQIKSDKPEAVISIVDSTF